MLLLLTLCGTAVLAADVSRPQSAHLSFGSDGTLKILQVADIQDDAVLGVTPRALLRAAIAQTKPDLIMLTGDNISGPSCPKKWQAETAIRAYMDIFETYGIPVAAVFGNHDDEDTELTKEEQFDVYESYNCFVGCKGVIAEKTVGGNTMKNVGTYNIPIYDAANSDKVVYNIWCFDSGNYNPDESVGGYGYVLPEQVDWYVETSKALQSANGGELVPSIAFQHIVPPHIYRALQKVSAVTPGSVSVGNTHYALPDGVDRESNWLSEAPCPPNTGFADGYRQLDTMLERGDVRAVFYGHDHVNHYVVPYAGIDLGSSAGCTYHSYNDRHRGFRLITIDKANLQTYAAEYVSAKALLKRGWFKLTVQAFLERVWTWIQNKVFHIYK